VSNPLAIAATTLTLQAILQSAIVSDPADTDLTDTTVTILPPDKARGTGNANQLNLFLYQILPNAAWRNMNIPSLVAAGETGQPPLALTLHYLLTAFGKDNDTTLPYGHHLLAKAMSILYDHAMLGPDEIRAATSATFPASDLDKQVERIRITLQPMSLEEISKLWTGLVTQYRLSVGYEVSVMLIESAQPKKTPLPVLTRGAGDKGVSSQASLIPPFPALDQIQFPNSQTSARLGDALVLTGNQLDGSSVGLIFNHPLWSAPVEIAPLAGGTATQVSVNVPNSAASWPAGFYTVSLMVQRPTETYRRATNQLSFGLAPVCGLGRPVGYCRSGSIAGSLRSTTSSSSAPTSAAPRGRIRRWRPIASISWWQAGLISRWWPRVSMRLRPASSRSRRARLRSSCATTIQ